MKDANDVLRQKQQELARVRREVESLKIVAALLVDNDSDVEDLSQAPDEPGGMSLTNAEKEIDAPVDATGTHGMFSSLSHQRPRRWNVLKRHS